MPGAPHAIMVLMPGPRTRWAACTIATLLVAVPSGMAERNNHDPFALFAPWIQLSDADRRRLAQGDATARTLEGRDRHVAVFAATRLDAPADAVAPWMRAIAALKRSQFVQAIGRFSDPPTVSDLESLRLDDDDLESARSCTAGDCGLKMSSPEIAALGAASTRAGEAWRDAVQQEFRRLLVARVETYRTGGLAAMAPHADRAHTQPLVEVFERLIVQSPWLARVPGVVEWLRDSPRADVPVETFFYWSRETYGAGRPVVGVWHVGMFRPGTDESLPPFVVVSKQIAATHYVDGAIGLTLVTHPDETGTRYLVYVNRSQIDVVGGFFGGIARRIVESRVRRETPVILQGLRTRIESGDPPMPGGHRLHE